MPPKPNYNRGDVVLALFPNSNLRTAKTRSTLIAQADNFPTGLPQVIVAMITSRVFRASHPNSCWAFFEHSANDLNALTV
jgi:mRNA interferase MazF